MRYSYHHLLQSIFQDIEICHSLFLLLLCEDSMTVLQHVLCYNYGFYLLLRK